MSWKKLITSEMEMAYKATDNLVDFVDSDGLDWKPAEQNNWMTMGQLLKHISNGCGAPFKGFSTGDWGISEEEMKNMKPEDMMPPAEKLPTLGSLDEFRELFAADKKTACEVLDSCTEERLDTEPAYAPWDGIEMPLGQRLLQMVGHLTAHKSQLFYYLKILGKPVNTHHLWGSK